MIYKISQLNAQLMKSVRATWGTNAYFLQVILRIRFCNDTIVFVNTVTTSPGMKLETEQTDHGDSTIGGLGVSILLKKIVI